MAESAYMAVYSCSGRARSMSQTTPLLHDMKTHKYTNTRIYIYIVWNSYERKLVSFARRGLFVRICVCACISKPWRSYCFFFVSYICIYIHYSMWHYWHTVFSISFDILSFVSIRFHWNNQPKVRAFDNLTAPECEYQIEFEKNDHFQAVNLFRIPHLFGGILVEFTAAVWRRWQPRNDRIAY